MLCALRYRCKCGRESWYQGPEESQLKSRAYADGWRSKVIASKAVHTCSSCNGESHESTILECVSVGEVMGDRDAGANGGVSVPAGPEPVAGPAGVRPGAWRNLFEM